MSVKKELNYLETKIIKNLEVEEDRVIFTTSEYEKLEIESLRGIMLTDIVDDKDSILNSPILSAEEIIGKNTVIIKLKTVLNSLTLVWVKLTEESDINDIKLEESSVRHHKESRKTGKM